ncbi:Elongation factor Tu-type domain [Phytophthora cactorum]|nr:Elongation factor Tu-type domain [Phytophthora cactorum]
MLGIETEEELHGWLVKGVFALGVVTYVATTLITAPYGRHVRPGWGPTPIAIWFAVVYLWGDHRFAMTPLIAASLWGCHYVYRSYVYPFLIRTNKDKRMPLTVMLSGDFYNMINAYINARYLSQFGDYSRDDPFTRPSFYAGVALFVFGLSMNIYSDQVLINLRKPGESEYKIPYGGLFEYVSSPNYFSELMEWRAGRFCPIASGSFVPTEATKEQLKQEDKKEEQTQEKESDVDAAAAAYLASLGVAPTAGGEKKDDKKKKKKGKKKPNADAKKDDDKKPMSAAAKALMERQAAMKAEQERLEQERLEQERIAQEEEAKRLAEIEHEEEIRRKKKEARAAKIERQKKEGTYMTKAQKQKAAKAQAALEAMQQAGLVPDAAGEKKKVVYTDNKKKNKKNNKKEEPKKEEPKKVEPKPVEKEEQEEEAEAPDAWDDEDWETSDVVASLEDKLQEVKEEAAAADSDSEGDEDLLGIALKKRQEEQAEQMRLDAEEERQRSKAKLEAERKKKEAAERRREREAAARANVSLDNLRSPICCIMGHVDTGKTKLLDNIRRTKVQDAEAGGITQQIEDGAPCRNHEARLPPARLLVIDTPGHESFTNLRNRGSSLCDIAILVVDIMHGLEPQTLESLRLLRQKKAPFVVALNKIDRCYGWKTMPDMPVQEALKHQNEHKLNAEVYWRNKDLAHTVSLIPTSAISGEGVPDLLMMLTRLTQERMAKSLAFVDILQCTVLEVKVIEGLGTTIDTILVNGTLEEGATIVVCTLDGPVVTTIRSLLTPHPMKEIRVKGEYIHHQKMKAAMGVKICAQGLEKAVAGTQIYVVGPDDDVEELKDSVMSDLTGILDSVKATRRGVMVQASTLGALEALLEFLRTCDPPIPVSCVNIGPVHKKDVMRASVQLEHQPEFATILAFDVKVHSDATELATELGVRIFTADIIYHLFDQFTAYMDNFRMARREEFEEVAVFPCVLKILPNCVFNKKDPIILGVDVEEGILKIGTPLVVPSAGGFLVGKVGSIEREHKEVDRAKKGASVAVRIDNEGSVMYGRHFDHKNKLVSRLTRQSIDALKENFREDLQKEDWQLVIKLKKVFDII